MSLHLTVGIESQDDHDHGAAAKFQDPSVQRAVASSAAANASLEDYNPFDPKQTQTKAGGGDAPAVMKPTQDAPPPYTASGQQQISSADFQVNPLTRAFQLVPGKVFHQELAHLRASLGRRCELPALKSCRNWNPKVLSMPRWP